MIHFLYSIRVFVQKRMSRETVILLWLIFIILLLSYYKQRDIERSKSENQSLLGGAEKNCGFYECAHINKFKTIVQNFNCQESAVFTDVLDGTNKFTIFVSLFVNDFDRSNKLQHIFHAGDPIGNTLRTPGVWLNNGYLHVRATSSLNFDDGGTSCFAPNVKPQLAVGNEYGLIFVYDINQISVFIDGKLAQRCKTSADIIGGKTLYVGKTVEYPDGLDVDLTLSYSSQALSDDQVTKCWRSINDNTNSDGTFMIPDADKNTDQKCPSSQCSIAYLFGQFTTIVKDFNCGGSATFTNILQETNKFTMSISMYVNDYNDAEEWQHILHAGDPSANTVRTPGVWINQGYLHIRGTSAENFDDGGASCFAPNLEPPLEKDTYYSLILVYTGTSINVFMNGKLIQICQTQGEMIPGKTLYVGTTNEYPNGPDIDISVCYLPQALAPEDIAQCWLYIKDLANQPVQPDALTPRSSCKYTDNFQGCGSDAIYFQNCQGQYLCAAQENGTPVWIDQPTTSCCFRFVNPIFNGQYPPNSYSIESMAYPGYYMRHASYIMRLDSPSSQQIPDDFVFQILPGLNDQPNSITLKPVQAEYNKSCFNAEGKFLQFTNGQCPLDDSGFKNGATFNTGNPNLQFS